jgi:hypothetical protein
MLQLYWSPIRFFDANRKQPPSWPHALIAPSICSALLGIAVLTVSRKSGPALAPALAAFEFPISTPATKTMFMAISALIYPSFCGTAGLTLLALHALTGNSTHPILVLKCTALAFYTQLPYGLLMVIIAWLWTPTPIEVPAGASTVVVLVEIREYQSTVLSEPLLSTGRLLSWYSLAWLIIVLALMLRTIDRLSFGATLTVALTLVSVFAAGPLLGPFATAIR